MLALTPPPDRAIPVLWQNFIRTFNVPGRLDTVPSAHSRSLAYVLFLPQTRTPLRVGAKCGRPHRGSNRALTTGTSVGFRRYIHSATEGTQSNSYSDPCGDSRKPLFAVEIGGAYKRLYIKIIRIAHCAFQRVWVFDVSLTDSQTLTNAT